MINFGCLLLASLLLTASMSSGTYGGDVDFTSLKVKSEDQTQIFYNRYHNALEGLDQDELKALQNSTVILVPGFLGEWMQDLKGYLGPIKDWLNRNSISYEIAKTQSTKSSNENAKIIRELIGKVSKSGKNIYIIAHSRGGIDTLLALTEDRPAAQISGIILIQSPIYGTWVSDAVAEWCKTEFEASVTESKPTHLACLEKIIWLTNGKAKPKEILVGLWNTVMAMRSFERSRWMKDNMPALEKLFRDEKIPLLSISTKDEGDAWRWTPYEIFRRKMWGIGISNDGIVPSTSMKVPETSFVLLQSNTDHSTLVEKRDGKSFFQNRVYEIAFDLVVDGSLSTFSND